MIATLVVLLVIVSYKECVSFDDTSKCLEIGENVAKAFDVL